MADIVEDIKKACGRSQLAEAPLAYDLLGRCGPEIDKLRKEVKLLKTRNAWLASANLILILMLVSVACGVFMAAFLSR